MIPRLHTTVYGFINICEWYCHLQPFQPHLGFDDLKTKCSRYFTVSLVIHQGKSPGKVSGSLEVLSLFAFAFGFGAQTPRPLSSHPRATACQSKHLEAYDSGTISGDTHYAMNALYQYSDSAIYGCGDNLETLSQNIQ